MFKIVFNVNGDQGDLTRGTLKAAMAAMEQLMQMPGFRQAYVEKSKEQIEKEIEADLKDWHNS